MIWNISSNLFPLETASLPKVPLWKVGAGGVTTAKPFPEEVAESVVPFCSTVSVQIISVASGCASTLGGMLKGLTVCCITQPQSICHWGQIWLLHFPFLPGLCSPVCESAFSGAGRAKPSGPWLCRIGSSCLGWGQWPCPSLLLRRAIVLWAQGCFYPWHSCDQDYRIWACLTGLLSTSLNCKLTDRRPRPLVFHARLATPTWHPQGLTHGQRWGSGKPWGGCLTGHWGASPCRALMVLPFRASHSPSRTLISHISTSSDSSDNLCPPGPGGGFRKAIHRCKTIAECLGKLLGKWETPLPFLT